MSADLGVEPFDRLHPVIQHHVVNSLGWPALRSLQSEAVGPLLAGEDAVLLAPTAGGKTEAAMLPLLTRMDTEQWPGVSLLYVCPLKALLNNLYPRVERYAGWLGRSAGIRHGDVGAGTRRRRALERPSVLLTTPESLEAMLVSRTVDAPRMFADLHAVVIDEVHAFAGDDRGWHLLAVLERLSALAGRPLQRVGLSATVGNPEQLLRWLQGRAAGDRPASVVAPEANGSGVVPELALDYVGNEANAALVISRLHVGEKRLVFADSRRSVEGVSAADPGACAVRPPAPSIDGMRQVRKVGARGSGSAPGARPAVHKPREPTMSRVPSIRTSACRGPASRLVTSVAAAAALVMTCVASAVPAHAVTVPTVRIATEASDGYEYVSVAEASSRPNAPIIQWSLSGAEQVWTLLPVRGYVQIVNQNSGQCIYADGILGDWLFQEPCESTDNHELWSTDLTQDYPVGHAIRSVYNNSLYMSVDGSSANEGTHLIQWTDVSGNSEYFAGIRP